MEVLKQPLPSGPSTLSFSKDEFMKVGFCSEVSIVYIY